MRIIWASDHLPYKLLKDLPDGLYSNRGHNSLVLKAGDKAFFLPNATAGHVADCRHEYLPVKTLTVEV